MGWNSNLFWCIIGIIGGAILSFIISLVFYFIGLKRKRLTYNINTFCLISKKINNFKGVEVKYNSKEIENLYSSTITIKNTGNSIIEKNDFPTTNMLSISTNGLFLLNDLHDTDVYTSNKDNNVQVIYNMDLSNNEIRHITFVFDYIAKKEEWTYTILHTDNIYLNGALKDGKIIYVAEPENETIKVSSILHAVVDLMSKFSLFEKV